MKLVPGTTLRSIGPQVTLHMPLQDGQDAPRPMLPSAKQTPDIPLKKVSPSDHAKLTAHLDRSSTPAPKIIECNGSESSQEHSICLDDEPGLEVLEAIRNEFKAASKAKKEPSSPSDPMKSMSLSNPGTLSSRSLRSAMATSSLSGAAHNSPGGSSKDLRTRDPLILKKMPGISPDSSKLEVPQEFQRTHGTTDPGIGRNGDNQDSYTSATFRDLNGCVTALTAVFDGHGPNGGQVSKICSARLQQIYDAQLNMSMQLSFPQAAHMSMMNHVGGGLAAEAGLTADLRKENRNNLINRVFKDSEERLMHMVFLALEEELREECNTTVSGTTATMCLLKPERFWLSAVGDSSAMLIRSECGVCTGSIASPDHRLSNNSEKDRVIAAGARVARRNGKGHMRIWLKELDTPGIMVTRSLGDLIGTSIGVTNEPEVKKFKLQAGDRFLVLATDGVWDVLDHDTIINLVVNAESVEAASGTLVQTALDAWVKKKNDLEARTGKQVRGLGDNITALVVDLGAWAPKSMAETAE